MESCRKGWKVILEHSLLWELLRLFLSPTFNITHLPRLEKDITGSPLATQPMVVFFNKTSTTIIPTPFNSHHFSSDGKIHFAYLRKVCSTFLIHLYLSLHNFNWSQPWETEENSNLPSFSCLSPQLPPPFIHRLSFLL